jgi:biopolymer transport protein TolQ
MLDYILGSSPVVSAVLLLLILASISSWAILVMKFRELRSAERDTEEFVEAYLESPLDAAYEVSRKHASSPLATVFRSGYTELARLEKMLGPQQRVTRDQVEAVISRLGWIRGEEVHRLERGPRSGHDREPPVRSSARSARSWAS